MGFNPGKFFKKAVGAGAGAIIGGAVGGPAGAFIGGIGGSAIASGGDIAFSDLAIGGIAGFAASDFDLGADIFGGAAPAAEAAKATAPVTAATGATSSAGGLLSRTLGSDWWKSPMAGHIAAAVGTELIRGDPYAEAARAQRRAQADKSAQYAKNYRRVAPRGRGG